jgi:hypothetical protein
MATLTSTINGVPMHVSAELKGVSVSTGKIQGILWDGRPVLFENRMKLPALMEVSRNSNASDVYIFRCHCGCIKIFVEMAEDPEEDIQPSDFAMEFDPDTSAQFVLEDQTEALKTKFASFYPTATRVVDYYFARKSPSTRVPFSIHQELRLYNLRRALAATPSNSTSE